MNTPCHVPESKVLELLLDAVCVVDMQGNFVFVSAACKPIFGYTPEEMIGRPMIDFVFAEDRARTLEVADKVVAGQPLLHFENRYLRKDGEVVHIMWSARWSEADQVRVAVARDITERKRADALQAALYAISGAAHAAEEVVGLFQQIHRILEGLLPATHCFFALCDESKDGLSFPYGGGETHPAPAPQKPDLSALCAAVIRTGRPLRVATVSGRGSPNWLGVPLHAKKGVIGVLGVQGDRAEVHYTPKDIELLEFVAAQITPAIERKQMEAWLQHIAHHDPMTGLPNRELFHDRLQAALRLAEREHTRLALLYLDLDKFKQVNDTLGHSVGDLLLQDVARRLRHCVRESDTVGRVGGDEFLVLLNGATLPEQAVSIAEKIRIALGQPFELAGRIVHIAPSIGIALYPEHGGDYKQLIRYADEAMYDAKKTGGNRSLVSARPDVRNKRNVRNAA